ncbi:hypothetical protein J3459_017514 [Metarhizium acridum]|uniref:Glucooligosaccharide oxidase n=1 Tax=Metarhizium acridum (strain CQMa 102) TaxID=655827 RepID=E9EGW3_METAQ|nr:glucooligosaccharide oxidase [Metarhizium acridum CQMa 102]EFY84859.1 glucooligosaccharide oxidase [Metarhizium acridum CQMa 102]KAG8409441.1 hypothetical protein J3459_017514 [Metarhizium acridum]KAG8412598.1 hypothetical protein J3458_014308 [Metarhizium acridum]
MAKPSVPLFPDRASGPAIQLGNDTTSSSPVPSMTEEISDQTASTNRLRPYQSLYTKSWSTQFGQPYTAGLTKNRLLLWSTITFALGLVAALYLARVEDTRPSSQVSCLASNNIPFVVEGSHGWEQKTVPWNPRLKYTPSAVATPQTADQIKAIVSCGIRNGVRVSAKSGGHSFGSFGFGGEDGHLVIALDQLNAVTVHTDGTARIQPGARLGHVATELYKQGKRAIPLGTCPRVGIAGFILHGGYGMAARAYGLTLDWLIGATVILANGTSVHCSATENADLFWAVRGAGSSFGIVAEFELKTFEAPESVTPFAIDVFWGQTQAVEGFGIFQDLAMTAPRALNAWLAISGTGQRIQGVWMGDLAGLNDTLRPLLGRLGVKLSYASTMSWIEAHEYFADGEELEPASPYNLDERLYATSLMVHAITESQIEAFMSAVFAHMNDTSGHHSWSFEIAFHGGTSSAIADIDPSTTAYAHRDKLLLYQFFGVGTPSQYPDDGFAVLQRFRDSITNTLADGDWGMYPNYIDTQLDVDTAQKLYWGKNLLRLRSIKADLDPRQVFWNPHGVRPLL